jgi:hypothetical protein
VGIGKTRTSYEAIVDDLYDTSDGSRKDLEYIFDTMEDYIDIMSRKERHVWCEMYNLKYDRKK